MNKLVWLVVCKYFEDTSIEGVFDSEEKAKSRMADLVAQNELYHFYNVVVHELE